MFYKDSNERGGYSAYDHADSIADAVEAYKRCRTMKTFVLNRESPDLDRIACAVCGLRLSERALTDDGEPVPMSHHGNRIQYFPRVKRFRAHHYWCGWSALMGAIVGSYSVAEAGARYERIAGSTVKA